MMFMKALFTYWICTMTTKPSERETDHNDCITKNKILYSESTMQKNKHEITCCFGKKETKNQSVNKLVRFIVLAILQMDCG